MAATIHAVDTVDPTYEAQWKRAVVDPALALDATLEALSAGWSGGLVGATSVCWIQSLARFSRAIDRERLEALSMCDRKSAICIDDMIAGTDGVRCCQSATGVFKWAVYGM